MYTTLSQLNYSAFLNCLIFEAAAQLRQDMFTVYIFSQQAGTPMAETNKKIAAALAAVNAYLQEEALQQQDVPVAHPQLPVQDLNIWGLSGRQDMMNMRQLIQMKAFSRF